MDKIIIHTNNINTQYKLYTSYTLPIYIQMQVSPSFPVKSILCHSTMSIRQIAFAQSCLIYLCDGFLVFYSPLVDEQVGYIKMRSNQSITPQISSLVASPDGKWVAVGEKCKNGEITLWQITNLGGWSADGDVPPTYKLKGHKHGVDMMEFSANSNYIISISNQDGSMFLWEITKGEGGENYRDSDNVKTDEAGIGMNNTDVLLPLTRNKLSKPINRIMFCSSPSFDLITIGYGYFKIWPFPAGKVLAHECEDGSSGNNGGGNMNSNSGSRILQGRVISFGKQFSTKEFIDVKECCGKIVLLSRDGMLCIMSAGYQKIEKWIDLMMEKANAMEVYQDTVLCAGDNALVKVIDLPTLSLKYKFPKPPPSSYENISLDDPLPPLDNPSFPAAVGVLKLGVHLLTLYSNQTMFMWTVEPNDVMAIRAILTHRGQIHSLGVLQARENISFFATSGDDRTIRVWHYLQDSSSYQERNQDRSNPIHNQHKSIDIAAVMGIKRNAYCRNLTRIIYSHSQHTINQISAYAGTHIACLTSHQFMLYSLTDFALSLHSHSPFQGQTLLGMCIEGGAGSELGRDDLPMIYIGTESGLLLILTEQEEELVQLKKIEVGAFKVEQIIAINSIVVVRGDGIVKLWEAEGAGKDQRIPANRKYAKIDTAKTKEWYQIQGVQLQGSHLILCQKKNVSFYSLAKGKKTSFISLTHELQTNEYITIACSNANYVVLLTNYHRLLFIDFAATLLSSEMLPQSCSNMKLTDDGTLLLISHHSIIMKKQANRNKGKTLPIKQTDMSWIDGSVWMQRSKGSAYGGGRDSGGRDSGIKVSNNVNPPQFGTDKSIGLKMELPNVALPYKTQSNQMSSFNPSNIYQQVNQVYKQVSALERKRQAKQKSQPKQLIANVKMEDSWNDGEIQAGLKEKESRRRKIFNNIDKKKKYGGEEGGEGEEKGKRRQQTPQQQEYFPKFTNNLVESMIGEKQSTVKEKSKDDTLDFGFSQFMEGEGDGQVQLLDPNIKDGAMTYSISQACTPRNPKLQTSQPAFLSSVDALMNTVALSPMGLTQQRSAIIMQNQAQFIKLYQILDATLGERKRKHTIEQIAALHQQMSKRFIMQLNNIK